MLTKIDFVVNIHITIKRAFHLAVRNVERQIVSRFVTGCRCFNLYTCITKAAWNYCLLLLWILRYWVTQTAHGECYLFLFLLYSKPSINYLRCAMLLDCTVLILKRKKKRIRCWIPPYLFFWNIMQFHRSHI